MMETPFRIAVFCGGPFAYQSIVSLAFEKYLCGIVLGSTDSTIAYNMEKQCEQANMPLLVVGDRSESDAVQPWLIDLKPDAVFSICFPYLIDAQLIEETGIPFINFHTGPLPQFRGPMPIFEVLRRGLKETALTAHFMDAEYDTGNIIYAESLPINDADTFTTVASKLAERCSIMTLNTAQMLQFGSVIPSVSQNEERAHFYPFPSSDELIIDWDTQSAETVIALVKACDGWYNGALTYLGEHEIRLSKVDSLPIASNESAKPGTILSYHEDESFLVMCADGYCIKVLQCGNENGLYSSLFLKTLGLENNRTFSNKYDYQNA